MMPIKRAPRKTHFTTIPNQGLQDAALSFKARGLLAYMLTMPDNWEFYEGELATHSTDGKSAIRAALKELSDHGYLVRKRERTAAGTLGASDWTLFDTPQPNTENQSLVEMPVDQQSENENAVTPAFPPKTDYPNLEKPNLDNRTLLNTNYTKDLLDKKRTTTTSTPDPLKPLQEFWEANGFGSITQYLWQNFEYWVNDFKDVGATDADAVALIVRGMQACVNAGPDKRNYGYLNGILKRYERNRFKSVAEVDAAEKARQERQANGTASKTQQHIELSPDQETAFKRFWGVYPSQVNESKAQAAYAVALSAKKADPDTLFKAACGYARQVRSEQKETRFIKQAANWINEDLWQADYSDFPAGYSDPDFDENADAEFLKHLGEPDTSGKYDIDPDDPFGFKKRGI